MSDQKPAQEENRQPGYTPASFEKRAAAWMGIAYVLMLLFVTTFAIYTGGRQLPGTFPLFLVPASIAVAAVVLHRMGTQALPAMTKAGCVMMLLVCAAGLALGLAMGVPALLAAFGG